MVPKTAQKDLAASQSGLLWTHLGINGPFFGPATDLEALPDLGSHAGRTTMWPLPCGGSRVGGLRVPGAKPRDMF